MELCGFEILAVAFDWPASGVAPPENHFVTEDAQVENSCTFNAGDLTKKKLTERSPGFSLRESILALEIIGIPATIPPASTALEWQGPARK